MQKGVFGVENNKPDAIAKLKELIKDEPRMEVCELLTKYPQGGERQLIYAVTGREINSKMLPADAGCIVDNVETMIAIKHAVKDGVPVMKRIATITGDAITTRQTFCTVWVHHTSSWWKLPEDLKYSRRNWYPAVL